MDRRMMILSWLLVLMVVGSVVAYQPDAPYLAFQERKGAEWAEQDKQIDAKLAALEAKFGKKPNIIYILTDDIGWGELGCFGQQLINQGDVDERTIGRDKQDPLGATSVGRFTQTLANVCRRQVQGVNAGNPRSQQTCRDIGSNNEHFIDQLALAQPASHTDDQRLTAELTLGKSCSRLLPSGTREVAEIDDRDRTDT